MDDKEKNQLSLFEFDSSNVRSVSEESTAGQVESQFSKYIVYVDESGDHSLQSVDENYKMGILLPFEIIFSDKKVMSSGLQLADLVARPVGLNFLRPEQSNRSFEVLKEKFYCDGGRENVGKNYKGLGLMLYPPPDSEKPR